ncbi:hypothetical protein NC653_014384 [Populus alba x Populus x berolinensis]|uniref:Uncharacterized protein n=1 Tax=Populus alba x Populus x berolinensis TaxID=444605 RepID=A0AAD6QWW2_9ROSI|nr:hypothetical protein NC653_014384 [Populus alba x Populus x berolinensis]
MRRMIKNRESDCSVLEREKQVRGLFKWKWSLWSVRLEEENEQLLKEKWIHNGTIESLSSFCSALYNNINAYGKSDSCLLRSEGQQRDAPESRLFCSGRLYVLEVIIHMLLQ